MTGFNRSAADVKQTVLDIPLGEYVIGLAAVLLAHAAKSSDLTIVNHVFRRLGRRPGTRAGTPKINDWNIYGSGRRRREPHRHSSSARS